MPKNLPRSSRQVIRQSGLYDGAFWAEVGRRLRAGYAHSATPLLKVDQDLLTDLIRGRRQGTIGEYIRVRDLCVKCPTHEGAFCVSELVRADVAIRRQQHRFDLAEALREEARAEHREELATLACLTQQSDASARTELREASYALSCAANLVHDAVAQ